MLILVAVTVNIAINGGIFEKARKAAFQTDVAKYKEELQAFLVENYDNENNYPDQNGTSTVGETISTNAFYGCTCTINIDNTSDSITGSPWGGTNATINWLR